TALFDAMRKTAELFECPLIGGDIAFHERPGQPLVCTVTVLAEPTATQPILRSGAKVGDAVYVTGALGGSLDPGGGGRHLTFEPRVAEAIRLAELLGDRLHAMIDLSDGLGRDASHIAARSRVRIEIDAGSVPCRPGCGWKGAMSDGEDYELCFAAEGAVPDHIGELPITAVGRVVSGAEGPVPHVLVHDGGQAISGDELGWQHAS
ncbi:MAG: thiamine-phosphate kinase, partial [Planctomycetota bacterium]